MRWYGIRLGCGYILICLFVCIYAFELVELGEVLGRILGYAASMIYSDPA